MSTQERRRGRRYSLGSLLVAGPAIGLLIATGLWVQSLRSQVALLETRVATLENRLPMPLVTRAGIPLDVEAAMLLDSVPGAGSRLAY